MCESVRSILRAGGSIFHHACVATRAHTYYISTFLSQLTVVWHVVYRRAPVLWHWFSDTQAPFAVLGLFAYLMYNLTSTAFRSPCRRTRFTSLQRRTRRAHIHTHKVYLTAGWVRFCGKIA